MINQNQGEQNTVVVVDASRTAIGAFGGAFTNIEAPRLGGVVIKDLLNKTKLSHSVVSEVIMGCVLSAGLGQAPARQAALAAGLPKAVPCTTLNKMCGSGLKAITNAYNNILANNNKVIIAGGMENMTKSPYLVPDARQGIRLGHSKLIDHMFFDGLEDAYNKGMLMGHFAEITAKKYNFTRQLQDVFAVMSAQRAQLAVKNNIFRSEIVKVGFEYKGQQVIIDTDEPPTKINIDKITKLKPAFCLPGDDIAKATVTPANSSSIADGASALLLMSLARAKELSLKPLAKIINYSEVAGEPEWFTTAPIKAISKLLEDTGLSLNNIDLFEINEAFAVVTMAAIADLNLDQNKVNIYGGACALGHPIGASGARIVTTLLNALNRQNKKIGVAALCIGGGEAMALAIERIN